MRLLWIYLLMLVVLVLPAGCGQADDPGQPVIAENVQLFYGSDGNEEFVHEERQIAYRGERISTK